MPMLKALSEASTTATAFSSSSVDLVRIAIAIRQSLKHSSKNMASVLWLFQWMVEACLNGQSLW